MLKQIDAERRMRRRLLAYARGVDRADEQEIASLYAPDGIDDRNGKTRSGVDAARFIAQAVRDRMIRTTHLIGGSLFTWIDADTCAVETPIFGVHLRDVDGQQVLERFGGRYHDLFVRIGDDWRASSRRVTRDWDVVEEIRETFIGPDFADSERADGPTHEGGRR